MTRWLSTREIPFASRPDDRFARVADGHYVLTAPALLNTDLEVDHLRRERYQLYGEVTVHCGLSGVQTYNGVLFTASVNLSSLTDRDRVSRTLFERTQSPAATLPSWRALVDELCVRTHEAERVGVPFVRLADVRTSGSERWRQALGFRLPERSPGMIFSDGDTLKTMTADALAVDLAGQGLNVAIADWEMTEDEHASRVARICGTEPIPQGIVYLNCTRPLIHERDRVAEMIGDTKTEFLICDSAAFACHDKPESAEAALAYFREVRRFGIGSLHIAHTVKGEQSDQKPFGSAFWFNSVRALWYAKRAEAMDSNVVEVGFYVRKFNLGARPPTHALRFEFSETTTTVTQTEAAEIESLAAAMPIKERIRSILTGGAQSLTQVAEAMPGVNIEAISRTVRRHSGDHARFQLFTRLSDGRFGLVERP